MSSFGLSRVVTISPFFMVYNMTRVSHGHVPHHVTALGHSIIPGSLPDARHDSRFHVMGRGMAQRPNSAIMIALLGMKKCNIVVVVVVVLRTLGWPHHQ